MRDELRLLRRRQVGDVDGELGVGEAPSETEEGEERAQIDAEARGGMPGEAGPRPASRGSLPPATDDEWLSSLLRRPGMAQERVSRLGRRVFAEPDDRNVLLSLNLPEDMAALFKATLEQRMAMLDAARAFGSNGDGSTARSQERPVRGSLRAIETFSSQGELLPRWVGLLSMLEHYVETYDDPRSCPRRRWDRTYSVAGWRCMAPGCTGRVNLHNHHIDYRSDQGSDEPWNQVCLCEFHHLQGEHGELAMVRGRGPLDIIFRIGRKDLARWYRNDKEIPAPSEPEERFA